jgi:sec-independent protein translocase protein TatA
MIPILAMITPTTMIVVGIIVLLLFGNRIPNVMRNLGQGITEFKKGMKELEGPEDESNKT